MRWLKITEIYNLTYLEAGSLKYGRIMLSEGDLREILFHPSFSLWQLCGHPGLVAMSLLTLSPSSHCLRFCVFV